MHTANDTKLNIRDPLNYHVAFYKIYNQSVLYREFCSPSCHLFKLGHLLLS